MRFFDCNTYLGMPTNPRADLPVNMSPSADELLAAMDRAGIERALVWHIAQHDYDALVGNDLLAEAIAPHDRLVGCWTILPTQSGELGDLAGWLSRAADAGVRAFRAFPGAHRYLFRPEVVGDLLAALVAGRWPLLLSMDSGLGRNTPWEAAYDVLGEFPELRVIVCDLGAWPGDRWFRPLVDRYPNVYVDLSSYLADGGIEAFVESYGPERLVYGSGFPQCYHGAMMLALAGAEISDADKQAIAAGNMERLIEEVRL